MAKCGLIRSHRISIGEPRCLKLKYRLKTWLRLNQLLEKPPADMVRELNKAIAKSVFSIQRGEIKEYQALGIRIITKGIIQLYY